MSTLLSSRPTPGLIGGRAGTHAAQRIENPWRMGPRLRGEDSGRSAQ